LAKGLDVADELSLDSELLERRG